MVYVLNKDGKPLMPTNRHGKVRRMLRDGLAKVVKREPFTIQLLYETTEFTQPIALGVDDDAKHIELSSSTNKAENLSAHQETRRNRRRKRKMRYRKPKLNNRKKDKG